jgi:hypothetical protein
VNFPVTGLIVNDRQKVMKGLTRWIWYARPYIFPMAYPQVHICTWNAQVNCPLFGRLFGAYGRSILGEAQQCVPCLCFSRQHLPCNSKSFYILRWLASSRVPKMWMREVAASTPLPGTRSITTVEECRFPINRVSKIIHLRQLVILTP